MGGDSTRRSDDGNAGAGRRDADAPAPNAQASADERAKDRALVLRLLDGDEQAVRRLVERYDRLIRYTIYRAGRRYCDRDPGWLDARANETWTGIVRSLRRAGRRAIPPSLAAYFSQIARNKCLDAVRRADESPLVSFPGGGAANGESQPAAETAANPLSLLETIEQLDALRDCVARLSEEDRVLCSEVELIMERRWSEAAQRLGIAESTLRSRWRTVLGKLRGCLEKKKSDSLAPNDPSAD